MTGANSFVPPRSDCRQLFARERARIRKVLGARVLGVERLGSSAVTGLAAKPALELLVGLDSLEAWEGCAEALGALGYEHGRPDDIPDRRFLLRAASKEEPTVNLSLCEHGGPYWTNQLAARDAAGDDAGRSRPLPLRGRRLWLAGIGGAGMSALALVAREWGAQVSGWDRVRTPYLEPLGDVPVEISTEPSEPPAGAEAIVSTAFAARIAGRRRGALLAELVALRRSIVVAGAHGKTTTAAMIAFCLQRLGLAPTFLIGGVVPQLGGNAGAGAGWLVAEGDESDRTLELLRPEIGVVTNIDLDHHSTFASRAEVEELFVRWLARCPKQVRGDELAPAELELAVPGGHNRRNAATALAALELAGVVREDAEAALVEFNGVARRLEWIGEAGGVEVLDDYGHHPAEIAATFAAAREAHPHARLLVLFQPHLFSRTRHLARELAAALAAADGAVVAGVYPAREEAIAGVTGKLIVDALAELRPGLNPGWAPRLEDGAAMVASRARAGDVVLTIGAGDVDRAAPLVLEAIRRR